MNATPSNETNAIRSEIETTRRQMDDTMDALRERFQGRHLIDEVLGFFRNDPERSRQLGQKLSQSASTAMHSVTDTLKANPVPVLLIGAGVAWMIYDSRRKNRDDDFEARYDAAATAYSSRPSDPDLEDLYDRPLDYPSSAATQGTGETTGYNAGGYSVEPGEGTSKFAQAKERASEATQHMRERLSDVGSRLRDRSHAMSEQARQLGSRVQERARETYTRSRERVVTTAHEHPLEVGLACLAAGVIAGLSIPTPERLNRLAGPSVDRLRERTREAGSELLQKGQRVASVAADAAKQEAEQQGLTPGSSTAKPSPSSHNPASQPQTDPLASRPVM